MLSAEALLWGETLPRVEIECLGWFGQRVRFFLLVRVLQGGVFGVGKMRCSQRAGHLEYRVSPAERVGHGFLSQRICDPLTVHYQALLVGAGQ
jgi:hypothetical protein